MTPTNRRILLVEDNPDDEALTLRALQSHQVANAIDVRRDGAEAIEYLFGAAGAPPWRLPALVLLDLKLPKLSGFDVLRRIREDERTRLLPVIILTASAHETDVAKGYGLGANSYIVKPVDFNQFASAMRELKLYWLVLNHPPPLPED